jgi:hypothetical protein
MLGTVFVDPKPKPAAGRTWLLFGLLWAAAVIFVLWRIVSPG